MNSEQGTAGEAFSNACNVYTHTTTTTTTTNNNNNNNTEQGDAMWNSIERGDLGRYKSALSSLRVKPTGRQGAPPSIPMRVFVLLPDTDEGAHLWDAVLATSRPIPAQTPDGGWTTLGQVLSALLPSYMPSQQQQQQQQQQQGAQGQGVQLHQQDAD
eukprot:1143072-Pelagomonas_calceolata.AAC.4